MNRIHGAFALIALAAAAVAAAQTPQQSMEPEQATPSQYPSDTNPPASTSQSDHSAKEARKQEMKDCMAQQQANNLGMSKKDMKKYCKNQVNNASPQS